MEFIPLDFPVRMQAWAVASFSSTEETCEKKFGKPHFVESDPARTAGGRELNWAWELPNGTKVLIVYETPIKGGVIYCDPPRSLIYAVAQLNLGAIGKVESFPKPILSK